MDRLESIFEMQKALNERIGVVLDDMPEGGPERAKWILNYARALSQETAELVDCMPWKWWYTEAPQPDWQNARVEIIDILHFLVSLALVAGMTADDFYNAYVKKNTINHKRQEEGYTKESKTEDDNRSI